MALFTNKPDGRLLVLFACLSLILGITGCQINLGPTEPITQSINAPFASDPNRDYQILSIKLTGIPFENVKIDQQKREILIDLPVDFTGNDLSPELTLTKNTTLVAGLGKAYPFRIADFCGCNRVQVASIGKVGSSNSLNYTVVVKTAVPLTLKPISAPLEFTFTENLPISLSVNNAYGNLPIVRAYVQRISGGTPVLIQGSTNEEVSCSSFACDSQKPGIITFNFSPSSLTNSGPGDYTLTLEQKGGRRLTLSQPIRFLRGEPRPNTQVYFGYSIVQGASSFVIQGSNLFADELTGKLTTLNGQSWQLKPISSAQNGTTLAMGIPVDLKPGYYALQLLRNGIELAACLRFSVRQSPNHPAIISMDLRINCLAKEPVVLKRFTSQSLIISYPYIPSTAGYIPPLPTLKLISTTDPNRFYSIPVTLPIEAFPRFTLPETSIPGSYKATIVLTNRDKTFESEPFEQEVIVQ